MPHSSGGGSHGGGFHGGSRGGYHGGGRGGGGSSSSFRRTYFSGASHRYVYYKNRRPHYYYSNLGPTSLRQSVKGEIVATVVSLVFLLLFSLFPVPLMPKLLPPKKLPMDYEQTEIVVDDRLGVIDNEEELYETLEEFQDTTGITPYILTISNADWDTHYQGHLEKYAFQYYINRFDDESHWLFVYSLPSEEYIGDWQWEGMQGDDTDRILTEKLTKKFNETLQKNLLKKNGSVGEAFDTAFTEIKPILMKGSIDYGVLMVMIIWYGIVGFAVFAIISHQIQSSQLAKAVEVDMARNASERTAMETRCLNCDGIYVPSAITRVCPFCGEKATGTAASTGIHSENEF